MEFPASEGSSPYGVLSIPTATYPSLVRRISGVSPISTSLSTDKSVAWEDIQISLSMNVTGLNNYYTKTEVNNSFALKQNGLLFPFGNTFDGWRLVSSDSIFRRLIGYDKKTSRGSFRFSDW